MKKSKESTLEVSNKTALKLIINSHLEHKEQYTDHGLPPIVYDSLELADVDMKRELLTELRGSLSLNKKEKKRVIRKMPTLSRFQVVSLIDVFTKEDNSWKEKCYQDYKDQAYGVSNGSIINNINRLLRKRIQEWDEITMELQRNLMTTVATKVSSK